MENPFISLKINADDISPLISSITKLLDQFSVPYQLCNNEHISLAYVLGDHKKEDLIPIINEICEKGFSVRISGFEVLEGQTTPFDYLALKLTQNDEFEYAKGFIKEHVSIKENFGGKPFEPHISVVKFEKGILNKDDFESLCRYLEVLNIDVTCRCSVSAKEIELYSKEYAKLDSVSFK